MSELGQSLLSIPGVVENDHGEAENNLGEPTYENGEVANDHEEAEKEPVEVRLWNALLPAGYGQDLLTTADIGPATSDAQQATADMEQAMADTSMVTPHVMTAWELAREESRPERERLARRRLYRAKRMRATQLKIPGFPDLDQPLPAGIWQGAGQVRLIRNYPNHLHGETLLRLVEDCDWKMFEIASAAGGGGKVSRGTLQKRLDRFRKLPAETGDY